MNKMFIFGAGGHSKVVIDIIERMDNLQIDALYDDDASLWGTSFFDYPVIGGRDCFTNGLIADGSIGLVAIGDNRARINVADWIVERGFSLGSAVHPSAQVGRGVHIGAGSVVMAGAVINSGAWIGENVVVNTGATIDHDCVVERGVHVAPGCNVCGNVTIGEGSLVGVGSVIIPGVDIGKHALIGAGSLILSSVQDGMTVIGKTGSNVSE